MNRINQVFGRRGASSGWCDCPLAVAGLTSSAMMYGPDKN
jgi:hypothetical protein